MRLRTSYSKLNTVKPGRKIRMRLGAGKERDKAIAESVTHCIEKDILTEFLARHFEEVCDMFDYGITYEDELDVRYEEGKEEGLIDAALKLMKKGMTLPHVINMLELSTSQVGELKRFLIQA